MVAETAATALALISVGATAWALWYLSRFEWWFLIYLIRVVPAVGIGVPIALLVARRRLASNTGVSRYLINLAWVVFGLWCLFVLVAAVELEWGGH